MCFFNFCIMFQGKNMLLFAEHLILYQEGQEKELPMSKVGHLSFTETQDHRLVTDVSTSDTTCDKKNLVVQWYIFLVAQTDPVAHFYRKIIFCYNKVIGIIFFLWHFFAFVPTICSPTSTENILLVKFELVAKLKFVNLKGFITCVSIQQIFPDRLNLLQDKINIIHIFFETWCTRHLQFQ